jgi:death-on-curing protein
VRVAYLDVADFLAISELVLDQSAENIAHVSRLELADSALHAPAASFGGVEFYPGLVTKAAVLCTRIVKNHPLPDGNKRVGFVCMIEFCLRNGLTWTPPPGDEDGEASAGVILELAAGPGDEDAVTALADWIRERTAS